MRLILRFIINHMFPVNCVRKVQIRRFAKAVANDRRNIVLGHETTLTDRILLYLDNNKDKNLLKYEEKHFFDITKCNKVDIKEFSTEQLIDAFNSLDNVQNRYEFLKLLNILDIEASIRLPSLTNNVIFEILQYMVKLIPSRILQYRFYNGAIDRLFLEVENLKTSELVHLIFFIGLQKKSEDSRAKLRKCIQLLDERDIQNLTKEEICIICNATFKASTKISNELFLNKVLTYLNDNLSIMTDAALFISLLKTIRHNRFQTDDLMGTISCTIFFNKTFECYPFTSTCHILALYGDYLYYDKNILDLFSKRCLEQLRQNYEHRAKDIKRFLWSLANLNYKLDKSDIKNVIIPQIFKRLKDGEFNLKRSSSLVEILLYLWMMEYRAYELVPYALTKENVEIIKDSKPKVNERLNLLLYLIQLDDPLLYKKLNINLEQPKEYTTKFQLKKRPELLKVYNKLKEFSLDHDLDYFSLNCQVPFVNIVGITGYRQGKKIVNIEVLDEYNCLKNTEEELPNGIMDLKLRILDRTDEGLIVLNSSELGTMSDAEFQEVLVDEIRLVC